MEEIKKELPETLDVMEAFFGAAFVLKKHFIDGVQPSDFVNIIIEFATGEEFKGKLEKAIEGAYKIPTELKDVIKGLKFGLIKELISYLIFSLKKLFSSSI